MADSFQLKAILSATDNISPALKSVGIAAKSARKYLADIASSAGALTGKLGLPMTMISGLAAGFSAAAIKNAVVGFTQMGEAVYKGSLRAGMSVEEYQKMKYVAEQAGVPVEALEGSMGKLNAQTAKAAAGQNKNLAGLYARLGISMRDGNGEIRTAVDLLPELADAFDKNKNPAVQARIGMALFGKQWAQIIPLLAEGSEALLKSSKRYETLKGMGLDKKAVREAKELGDQFRDLDWVLKGFQNTIAKQLVPIISPLVEDVIEWAAANRKVIASGVKEFVQGLVASLKEVDWKGMMQGVREFGASFAKALDFVGPRNALIALVIYMNMQTIAAFTSLIGATWRASAALLSMSARAIPAVLSFLGLYTPATVAAAAATDTLAASTVAAEAAATGWLSKLTAIAGVLKALTAGAAPLAVMYGAANWAGDPNDNETNVKSGERAGWMQENLVGPAKGLLSKFGFDKDADIEQRREANRDGLLVGGPRVRASGEVVIRLEGAPPGSRVESVSNGGDISYDVDMGYRSFALGLP